MQKKSTFPLCWFAVTSLLLVCLGGCATGKKAEPKTFTFFPPAPDEPRIQFLTAFSMDKELGRKRTFADFITGEDKSVNPLVKPYGLALHGGKLFVCDTVTDVIVVFDLEKRRAVNFAPKGEGKLQLPVNITIDQDGTRYVADTGRNQILVYNAKGIFLEALGKKDEFKPTDVAVSVDRLYVADLKGHCVRVYNKADRKLLFSIPADDKATEGKLLSPTNLALDSEGRVLVSDTGGNVVKVYDRDGKYLRSIGKSGVAPGLFARPKGVAVDHQGIAYVVDAATQVVQLFDTQGRLLLFFGAAGASMKGELVLPAAVIVDYDHVKYFERYLAPGQQCEYLILVTSQFGGQKVSVYGFLKKK